MQSLLDAISLLPFAGVLKYTDETTEALKAAAKHGDEATGVIKHFEETTLYKEIKKYPAESANKWFSVNVKANYKPPYKYGTSVKEIVLIEDKTFVRVYDKTPKGSGMYGNWILEKSDIDGLSPTEIQNKFALPNTPKYICDVKLKAGTRIRKGIANQVEEWGSGGGTQYDLIGQRIGEFINERLLEDK